MSELDSALLKAFLISGAACAIGVVVSVGPRTMAESKHPAQAIIGSFAIGGLGGTVVWWILLSGNDGHAFSGSNIANIFTMLLNIFGWIAIVYFSICLIGDLRAWQVTSRAYSGKIWHHIMTMVLLVLRSKLHYYIWTPAIAISGILLFSIYGEIYPFSFIVSLLLFCVHILLYQIMPPTVLLLGTSRQPMFPFRNRLDRALHPYRVIVLLEPTSTVPNNASLFARNLFEWDNLRISGEAWQSSVFSLIGAVPAVIVDARVATDGVVEEIQRVAERGFLGKAIFVTDEEGSAPALSAAGVDAEEGTLVSDAEVAFILKRSRLKHTTSPDDHPAFRHANQPPT